MRRVGPFAALFLVVSCSGDATIGSEPSLEGPENPPGEVGDPGGPGTGGGDHTGNDNALGCPSVLADVTSLVPTVVMLVDRSGTMEHDFGPMNRWDAVYQTLMDPQSGIVANYQHEVSFGLALYSGEDNNPTCPLIDQIAPSMGNFDAIDARYAPLKPIEDTPTAESLNVVAPQLAALDAPGPKAIIVATDGLPDTCAAPDPDGQPEARAMAVAAAANAYRLGIETFIISVGEDVTDDHLQEMANAGIGLDMQGPERAPFWRALSPIALEDAFDGIVAGIQGCDFALDGAVPAGGEGVVSLDGVVLDSETDWEMVGNQTIRLIGSACETMRDGGDHTIEAIFTCSGDVNHPGNGGGGYLDPDDPEPPECVEDDDCEGDDICNNAGYCEAPPEPDFPVVE